MALDFLRLGGIIIILATITVAGIKAWKGHEGATFALFFALLMTGVIFS